MKRAVQYIFVFVAGVVLARASLSDGWGDAAAWALVVGVASQVFADLFATMLDRFNQSQR